MKQEFLNAHITANNDKINTAKHNAMNAIHISPKTGKLTGFRKQLSLLLKISLLEEETEDFLIIIANYNDPLYKLASIITYHSLKVLSKGRKFIDKEGNTKFTPSNEIAQKILRQTNSSVNFDDLLQDVVLSILEHTQNKTITIDYDTFRLQGDEQARIAIFNTVQNRLYSLQEKHAKHLYNVTYTENENGEQVETDTQMYTLSQRAYDLSINSLEYFDLINRLKVELNENEKLVLKACFETKQVLKKSTSKNSQYQYEHYITKTLTLEEKANFTGLTVQNVRTALKSIQSMCTQYLLENNTTDCRGYIEKVVLFKIK